MFRKVIKDGVIEKIPRQMIIVTFAGNKIPQFIYINKVRCPVDTYVHPVMQCYNCLRYGHSASQCKGKKKCRNCGKENDNECTQCDNFCIFCNSNSHNSTNRDCSEYKKQKRTKEAMAHLNISFKEAEKVIDNPAYTSIVQKNRFAPLLSSTTEFPSLVSRPNAYSNISQSSSKHLTSIANISNIAASTRKKKTKNTPIVSYAYYRSKRI
uniref:Uncharacterized protein LOC114340238 isoform X1 n=2 Tax=Diabrotica virgifera virgifera TaxID=50390 RepID=A0A6P7GLE8_DIAVI